MGMPVSIEWVVDDLKPCPWCGAAPSIYNSDSRWWMIGCRVCLYWREGFVSEEQAREWWTNGPPRERLEQMAAETAARGGDGEREE